MRFSIIVPIYKVEKYLCECIESILSQGHKDYELILVDDGSPDNCPLICDEYARANNQIKVIHKENGGLVSARQAGAEIANGEYILNVDGDDFVEPKWLETIDKCIHENPDVDIIQFAFNDFSEGKKIYHKINLDPGNYDRNEIENLFPKLIRSAKGEYFPPNIWAKAIKRSIYKFYQQKVDKRVKIGEDACVSVASVYVAKKMIVIDDALYNYRNNIFSMTKDKKKPYSWLDAEFRLRFYSEIFPLDNPIFYNQICRFLVRSLFVTARTILRTDRPYKQVKDEILKNFNKKEYSQFIKNCKFKSIKESLAAFAVKHKVIWMIKLYSKF